MAGDWGRVLANLNDGITKNMLCARADKTDAWQVGKRVWSRRAAALQGGTMRAWHCRGRALMGARIVPPYNVAALRDHTRLPTCQASVLSALAHSMFFVIPSFKLASTRPQSSATVPSTAAHCSPTHLRNSQKAPLTMRGQYSP